MQAIRRHDGPSAAQFRLAEDEFEDRNEQVEVGHRDHPTFQALQQPRGVVLPALGVVGEGGIEAERFNLRLRLRGRSRSP
jgi:hypothetical protein